MSMSRVVTSYFVLGYILPIDVPSKAIWLLNKNINRCRRGPGVAILEKHHIFGSGRKIINDIFSNFVLELLIVSPPRGIPTFVEF